MPVEVAAGDHDHGPAGVVVEHREIGERDAAAGPELPDDDLGADSADPRPSGRREVAQRDVRELGHRSSFLSWDKGSGSTVVERQRNNESDDLCALTCGNGTEISYALTGELTTGRIRGS